MKTQTIRLLVLTLAGGAVLLMLEQAASAASPIIGTLNFGNGSYGPINFIQDTTLDVPADGFFQATTVNISAGATLRFRPNANNTAVIIGATGAVTIDGKIDLSGKPGTPTTRGEAGSGGFPGGMPATAGYPPGDGQGPGAGSSSKASGLNAGRGGAAAHLSPSDPNIQNGGNGLTYGDFLGIPAVGGSGGSGYVVGSNSNGGGGGGGAITIGSAVKILVGATGSINADGGSAGDFGGWAAGSGGFIRLVAPEVGGSGVLSVQGGSTYRAPAGGGGVRIDQLHRSPLPLQYFGASPSLGSVMMLMPATLPQLRIKSVDGNAIDPNAGSVTIVRSQGASSQFDVVVEARDFNGQLPTELFVVPDSGSKTVLAATIDNRNATANPAVHTFTVTAIPNVRVTLQVFGGKSLPANP